MKNIKNLIPLHILIAVYSMGSLFSKLASRYEFLSLPFCLCYAGVIGVLGIYAVGWQQIIKRMPLTTAFANKAVTVLWGLVFGILFFQETVTPGKLAGIALVIVGVVLFAGADKEADHVE